MIQDQTKSQEKLAARDERYKLKITLDKQREAQWNQRFRNIENAEGDLDKITWEEALEGKGFYIKKSDVVSNGKYSDIWKVKKKDEIEELVVKVVRLKNAPKHFCQMYNRRNLKILCSLSHPSLVKIHKMFILQNREKLYIFMDFCEKGNLSKIIKDKSKELSESQVVNYFKDVANALSYLHGIGLAHRFLTLEQILISSSNKAKLTCPPGFGEICDIEQNGEVTPCWMEHEMNQYITPEALAGEPHCPFTEDIWAFGICVYTSLCQGYPFDGYKDKEKLFSQIKDQLWLKKSRSKGLSSKAKSFLEKIFQLEPLQRPSIDEIQKDFLFIPN